MNYARFERTEDPSIPATVRIGEQTTPVWIQSAWTEGEYAQYIRRNGCGHCCAAMAANLHGVKTDPYQTYLLCHQLWGPPEESKGQDHFQTVAGITAVLRHWNIPCEAFGVAEGQQKQATDHILDCLRAGKQVIFVSDPFLMPNNPFSTGYHYVMAVGFDRDGKILIANSSENTCKGGVQSVDPIQITNALFLGGTADSAMTWGIVEVLYKGCTYVVVG